jgi:hypothetical protein
MERGHGAMERSGCATKHGGCAMERSRWTSQRRGCAMERDHEAPDSPGIVSCERDYRRVPLCAPSPFMVRTAAPYKPHLPRQDPGFYYGQPWLRAPCMKWIAAWQHLLIG